MSGFDRLGVVRITTDMLAVAVTVLAREGFAVVGSLHSDPAADEVALIVAGDGLPDDCQRRPVHEVGITFCKTTPARGFLVISIGDITSLGPYQSRRVPADAGPRSFPVS